MLPVNKLGWVAGVIDLKGRIVVKNNKRRATPQRVLIISTKELTVIEKLSELTNISPEYKPIRPAPNFMRKGCIVHCPEKHHHVDSYPHNFGVGAVWSITGASAVIVLSNVIPYMTRQTEFQEFIDKAIEETVLHGRGAQAVITSMRRLVDLGWTLPVKYEHALEVGMNRT